MSFCHPFANCCDGCNSFCPFPDWIHPLLCNPTQFCCVGSDNGPTLVIHSILLEPCGNQSCTPRTLRIRVTGPSFPCGEFFTLRVGSCTEIDEPLVITNLEPGQYEIEQILSSCREFDTTFTGPICNGCVSITNSIVPTVITIVNRKRFCRRCHRHGFGCNGGCNNGCGCNNNCGCNSGCGCNNNCGCNNGCGQICDCCGCRSCCECFEPCGGRHCGCCDGGHHHREREER